MKRLAEFHGKKHRGEKLSLVTVYDYPSARIAAASAVDALLVGDSVAMVVHGFPSTIHATVEMMELHTSAARRGAPEAFIIADMPFLAVRKGSLHALETAERLLRAGAWAVKVEGVGGHEDSISQLVESGIPVMGHLGLEPQSVFQLGGYRVQGRAEPERSRILSEVRTLEARGVFAVVLECISADLGAEITESVRIPTIGIGAGPHTDGQVLVWHDLLGLSGSAVPKFVRRYTGLEAEIVQALNRFHADVAAGRYPGPEESYL